MIVLFYTCWHGHLLLGVLLAMFLSCDYYITGKIVNFYCGYLVKRKLPTFVSNQYTGIVSSQLSTPETDLYVVYLLTWSPNNWGFAGHVTILRLYHTWKYCQLLLRLSHKEKMTDFCIYPIHRACMFTIIHPGNWSFCCILSDMVTQYLGLCWPICNLATIPYPESLSTFIVVIS